MFYIPLLRSAINILSYLLYVHVGCTHIVQLFKYAKSYMNPIKKIKMYDMS